MPLLYHNRPKEEFGNESINFGGQTKLWYNMVMLDEPKKIGLSENETRA